MNTQHQSTRQRVRFTYEKGEQIKFISHQDEFRLWERTLRRADLPLLYKQGYNPQPHMQFAAPLALGMTGSNELLDAIFSPPVPLDELADRIRRKLPPGARLHGLEVVPVKVKSPQSLVIGADYTILLYAEPEEIPQSLLQGRIDDFLSGTEIWRQRERHGQPYQYNLRPLVFELRYRGYHEQAEEHRIFVRVQMRPGATGRPDELVDALGFDDYARTLRRDRIYFDDNETDRAIFDQYPVISQEAVSPDKPKKRRRKRRTKKEAKNREGDGQQSLADKAAEEFV